MRVKRLSWSQGGGLALALGLAPVPAGARLGSPSSTVAAASHTEPAAPSDAAVRAQRHFEAKEWDQAVEALMEAYAIDPDPAFLYARAQAERMRGNCRAAIALYERFLASNPTAQQRNDTERHIRLCEEMLFNAQVETETSPSLEPVSAREPPPPEPRRSERAAWRRDPLGLSLTAVGSAAVVGGIVVLGLGTRTRAQAAAASTEVSYEQRVAVGQRQAIIGGSVAAVGLALALGGVVRLLRVARRPVGATAWWGPTTAGVALRGRF